MSTETYHQNGHQNGIDLSNVYKFSRQVPANPILTTAVSAVVDKAVCLNRRVVVIEQGAQELLTEDSGYVTLFADHESHMDGVTVAESFQPYGPYALLVAADSWDLHNPINSALAHSYNMVPVERKGKQVPENMTIARPDDLLNILNDRINVIFSPAGGRGIGFQFQKGAAYLAAEAEKSVITVGLAGGKDVMPKGSKFPSLGRTISIYIDAISYPDLITHYRGKFKITSLTDFFQDRMKNLHQRAQELIHHDWSDWAKKTGRLIPHFGYVRVTHSKGQIYPPVPDKSS